MYEVYYTCNSDEKTFAYKRNATYIDGTAYTTASSYIAAKGYDYPLVLAEFETYYTKLYRYVYSIDKENAYFSANCSTLEPNIVQYRSGTFHGETENYYISIRNTYSYIGIPAGEETTWYYFVPAFNGNSFSGTVYTGESLESATTKVGDIAGTLVVTSTKDEETDAISYGATLTLTKTPDALSALKDTALKMSRTGTNFGSYTIASE